MQPDRIAALLEAGADIVVRSGWRNARWLDAVGVPSRSARRVRKQRRADEIDSPDSGRPQVRPSAGFASCRDQKAAACRRSCSPRGGAIRQEGRQRHLERSLAAAYWIILVTSLPADDFSTDDILALYRLRWRIELAFKRLKSLIGLKAPPGVDERSAKPYVLAHLLVILLARTADRRVRGLSPLGTSRLTRPGAWRLLLQLTPRFCKPSCHSHRSPICAGRKTNFAAISANRRDGGGNTREWPAYFSAYGITSEAYFGLARGRGLVAGVQSVN